jgi:hypothetical protein
MAPVAICGRRALDALDEIRGNRQRRSGPEHWFKPGRAFPAKGNNGPDVGGARVAPSRPSRVDLRLSAPNCLPRRLQNLLAKPTPSR